jgi:predicted PurR-regulated permease PerM
MSRPQQGTLAGQPLILLAIALFVLYWARPVLIPLAIAVTLNFLLAPALIQIERLKLPRIPAVLAVVLLTFALAGTVSWIVARQIITVVNDLPNYRDNIHEKLSTLHLPTTGPLSTTVTSIREIGDELSSGTEVDNQPEVHTPRGQEKLERGKDQSQPIPVTVVPAPQSGRQYLVQYARPALERIGALIIVFVFTIYMLLKREDLRNRLLLLAGVGRLNLMTQALNDAAARISRYLVMNVLVNIGYGLIFGASLYLLGVPNATLWGALMAILRMVPYVGTMIAGLSTLMFTLAVFNGWWHALWVLLLFAGLELVIANFVEPQIYGKRTGISAFALVVMAIVWTMLWGWPGLIVSTPLTVCLIVLGRHVPQMSFLHILLGEDAALSPEASFYERLLAMDQPEAHAIADRFLKGRTLGELYDEVVLPALLLSERDRHKGALDEVHSIWLYQSSIELIAELTDYQLPLLDPDAEHCSPVVCIPAEDRADEIAGTMLAQLLERCGHRTLLLSQTALSPEIMARLAEDAATILCISAAPPFAFAQARKLAQTLRQSLPRNGIVIGLWGSEGEADALRARFGNARPNAVAITLEEALKQVKEIDAQRLPAPAAAALR